MVAWLAAVAAPWAVGAVAYGPAPVTIALGGGMTVERHPRPCEGWRLGATGCFAWRAVGLSIADPPALGYANMFAAARGGRVVAVVPGGVWLTDDRGAHWRAARWESPHTPLAVAFDAGSDFGVVVGTNGSLWTTEDRGVTWRLRRDAAGQVLVDVVVVGRTVAYSDARGGVWVSTDGGTSVRTLADEARGSMPTMAAHRGAIWILLHGAQWWRADAAGSVERVERTAHPGG